MWFFLALASAFFYSFRRFSEKNLANKAEHFTLGFVVQAFSLPLITLLLWFTNIPTLTSLSIRFWLPLLIIWIFLYPAQAYFYYKSLKEGEITYVLPLMSLIPIFNILSSWILIHEVPSFIGFLGIITIVAGVYSLNIKPNMNIFSPFTYLFKHKPALFMIINCLCLATGSTLDKIAIQASNPLFYSFINTLGASLILLFIAKIMNPKFNLDVKDNFKSFTILGFLQAAAFTGYIVALSTGIVS
ncbi:MAG: EamA-like transporter family [Microgenomates group bacterium Gr01-1014_7]|nr:MAG: EamA-like transporter family [Microgenomates group bacterium Gr01-1014_7]